MKKHFAALLLLTAVSSLALAFDFGVPVSRSLDVSTAYQANDPTKAAVISFSLQCSLPECTLEARVGMGALDCTSGTVVGEWVRGWPVKTPASLHVPIGASFILCPLAGEYVVPIAAADQSAG
jgi:hypothetical protein